MSTTKYSLYIFASKRIGIIRKISTSPILQTLSTSGSIDTEPFEELSSLSKSQYLSSTQQQELTVDNIEDFDDDDDLDELDSRRYSRRVLNDAVDLVLGLPLFATAIGDDHLREIIYEILLAAAGPSWPHCTIKGHRRSI